MSDIRPILLDTINMQQATAYGDVRQASLEIRLAARRLMQLAVDDPTPRSAHAAWMGLRIAHETQAFDRFIAQAHEAGISLQPFLQTIGPLTPRLTDSDAHNVRFYIQQAFSPLLELVAQEHLQSWWSQPGFVTREAIDTLAVRVAGAADDSIDAQVHEILIVLLRAWPQVQWRPIIAQTFDRMQRVLALVQRVDEHPHLTDEQKRQVRSRLRDALVRYQDHSQRREALFHLDVLVRCHALLDRIRVIQCDDDQKHILPTTTLLAVATAVDQASRDQGLLMLDWLDRVTHILAAYHTLDMPAGPLELRKAFQAVQIDVVRTQRIVLDLVERVRRRSNELNLPATISSVRQLEILVSDLRTLAELPRRLERVTQAIPQHGPQVHRRLMQLVSRWPTSARSAAAEDVAAFSSQVDRFLVLPGEDALRRQVSAGELTWPQIKDHGPRMLEIIERSRRKWALAWTNDTPATQAGSDMATLEAVMQFLRDSSIIASDIALDEVTRWAALPLDATRWRSLLLNWRDGAGQSRIRGLVDMIVNEQFLEAATLLSRWSQQDVACSWIAAVHHAVRSSQLPQHSPAVALSHWLELQPDTPLGTLDRQTLAHASWMLNEYAFAVGPAHAEAKALAMAELTRHWPALLQAAGVRWLGP